MARTTFSLPEAPSRLSLLVLALAGAFAGASQAAPAYHLVDLGAQTWGSQINSNGYISGDWHGCPAIYHDGQWQILNGKCRTVQVMGVDQAGESVGTERWNHPSIATKWAADGTATTLVPDAKQSFGTAIRTDGTVYGAARPASGHAYPFSWSAGHLTKLPSVPGWAWTVPVAANKSHVLAGTVSNEGDLTYCPMQAAMFADGAWTLLGTLGGSCSEASAINVGGTIVGDALTVGDQLQRAFFWKNGAMTDLGSLGGVHSWARDINASGDIVGGSTDAAEELHPFLYTSGQMLALDQMVDAIPPGQHLDSGQSINDLGEILALGGDGQYEHAYLLTPLR
jgi:probable HAF family extracellular repeat protein